VIDGNEVSNKVEVDINEDGIAVNISYSSKVPKGSISEILHKL